MKKILLIITVISTTISGSTIEQTPEPVVNDVNVTTAVAYVSGFLQNYFGFLLRNLDGVCSGQVK